MKESCQRTDEVSGGLVGRPRARECEQKRKEVLKRRLTREKRARE